MILSCIQFGTKIAVKNIFRTMGKYEYGLGFGKWQCVGVINTEKDLKEWSFNSSFLWVLEKCG